MRKFNHLFKILAISLTVAMMATVVSCGSKDDDSEPPVTPTLSVTPSATSITFPAEGQTNSYTVATNQSTWNVNSSDPSWLTATKSGTGFTLTASANNTSSDRTATVTVSATGATSVTITAQQPKMPEAPTLSITPSVTDIQFSATGNVATSDGNPITPTFTVETNQTTWDVNSSAPTWLTATKSGTSFTLTATANTTSSDRTATVTVSAAGATGVTINIRQKTGYEDITAAKLTNYAVPFRHKAATIIDQGDKWNYDVDGGWLYNTVGGSNGVVFLNAAGSYNCTLAMQAYTHPLFPSQNMVNGKLYQTVELEAGNYKFTANIFAVWGYIDAYVVAASGNGLPDIGAVNSTLAAKQIPTDNGDGGLPPVTVEFTLSQKTTVSLGFVTTIADAEFHISAVQLMWEE